jgi:ribosomal protein L3
VHDRVPEENLLLVRGAVPGHKNATVVVREDKRR